MHVEHRLPAPGPGVEDDTVAVGRDPLGLRDPVRLGRHLGQQAAVRGGQRGQVRVVLLGDDKDVGGGLRVEIPEGDCPATFGHQLGRDVTRHDLAEEAVRHGGILACTAAQGPRRLYLYGPHDRLPAYIVGSLRSLWRAPPRRMARHVRFACVLAERRLDGAMATRDTQSPLLGVGIVEVRPRPWNLLAIPA